MWDIITIISLLISVPGNGRENEETRGFSRLKREPKINNIPQKLFKQGRPKVEHQVCKFNPSLDWTTALKRVGAPWGATSQVGHTWTGTVTATPPVRHEGHAVCRCPLDRRRDLQLSQRLQ